MKKEELIEKLTEDIASYVMKGEISDRFVADKLSYEELEDRLEEYEELVRLHFILQDEVVNFVQDLEHHLREIKTETKRISNTTRGGIDGRINWSKTRRKRYSEGGGNPALFVCDNRTENYDIPENLVLKQLLSIIYSTLEDFPEVLDRDYKWVNETWQDEGLVDEMKNIFERNVHVKRIREPEKSEPTERMVSQAKKSRQEIYRNAGDLLEQYSDILSGEESQIQTLLEDTAITPDDQDTLLELYVLFRYIAVLRDITRENGTLKTIRSGKQEVAQFEGEKKINVYHDNSGPDEMVFKDNLEEKNKRGEELSRTEKIQRKSREIFADYMDKDLQNHTGRPDVIVLEVEDGDDFEYLVTEVKNSTNEKTVRRGIKETLEYLAFLKVDGTYRNSGKVFGRDRGVLVVQDFEKDPGGTIPEDSPVRIFQAGEVESSVKKYIKSILE